MAVGTQFRSCLLLIPFPFEAKTIEARERGGEGGGGSEGSGPAWETMCSLTRNQLTLGVAVSIRPGVSTEAVCGTHV